MSKTFPKIYLKFDLKFFISLFSRFYYYVITKQINNNKYYIITSCIPRNIYFYVITITVYHPK